MSTLQHPINSGFGYRSTVSDVLDGIDLSGKLVIVTGGYSGLGLETTRGLAAAGARVIVPARRVDTAAAGIGDLNNVQVARLDLADLASVQSFADELLRSGEKIDIIINNAGIMAAPEARVGQGWESHFAVNHLGHFALVNLLLPALSQHGARIVSVSSAGHHVSGIRWSDVHFTNGYDKWLAYAQSKTANALFAFQLDIYGANQGIRAYSLHPGPILTPLQRHLTQSEMSERGWVDEFGEPADTSFKTPEQGAATQVWAATSSALDGIGGVYCEDCDVASLANDEAELKGVRDYAVDVENAHRLWKLSAKLTGVNAFSMSRT